MIVDALEEIVNWQRYSIKVAVETIVKVYLADVYKEVHSKIFRKVRHMQTYYYFFC